MATNRKTGWGSAPDALPSPSPPEAAEVKVLAEPQGTAIGTRTKRPAVWIKTTGRKLHLPDDVHDRLWQLSRQRRTTVSAVAAEILDNHLPRFKIERED